MSFTINYTSDINLEINNEIKLSNRSICNYNPVYKNYFDITENQANNSILNYDIYLKSLTSKISYNVYEGITNKNDSLMVFIKYCPLINPVNSLIGKENSNETSLPQYTESSISTLNNSNNSAFVDGFFSFLTSKILHTHNFLNALDCFGSYSLYKDEFKYNIQDDIDYLCDCEHFLKHKEDFQLSDIIYDQFDKSMSQKYKKKIVIEDTTVEIHVEHLNIDTTIPDCPVDLSDFINEPIYKNEIKNNNTVKTNRTSDCSSRSSVTCSDFEEHSSGEDSSGEIYSMSEGSYSYESVSEEPIYAILKDFPVNMVLLEKCTGTLDEYSLSNEVTLFEWNAILMQVIMSLILFQEKFYFIHNDLHDSNIMYIPTDKQYLYYKYNDVHYKVPTFGKIWKIIDFGRSIYKFKDHIYFSDSFSPKGDASTQYNCEPYLDKEKNIVPPNFSFDLCRLASSLYDFFFDDDYDEDTTKNPIQTLIEEWVTDDKGRNILYKKNGDERYPDFKLYKMITRSVHNHIPKNQLKNPLFSQYSVSKKNIKKKPIMNIDIIPCYA